MALATKLDSPRAPTCRPTAMASWRGMLADGFAVALAMRGHPTLAVQQHLTGFARRAWVDAKGRLRQCTGRCTF